MKKTFDINICGIIFHIDEDAYERLNAYMLSLKKHFSSDPGSDEIIADIEARIAELMQEKITDSKQVVNLVDISNIIEQMGSPDQISSEEDEDIHEKPYEPTSKRMYRDLDNKLLGGVAAGLAAYFKTDPVWFRLGFVVMLFFGLGFLLYPILWLVIPAARTTAEKLEMRGKRVTIDNIEASFRNEFQQIGENLGGINSDNQELKNFFDKALAVGGAILTTIWKGVILIFKAFKIIIGLILMILGISLIIGLIVGMFGPNIGVFPNDNEYIYFSLPSFLKMIYGTGGAYFLALLSGIIILIIPIIALIWSGLRLMTRKKLPSDFLGLPMLYIWLAAALSGIILGIMAGVSFNDSASTVLHEENFKPESTILYVTSGKTISPCANGEDILFASDYDRICQQGEDLIIGSPRIKYNVSPDSLVHIKYSGRSDGKSHLHALKIAESIKYNMLVTGNTIELSDYFRVPEKFHWRDQSLRINILVPEGIKVITDQSISHMFLNRHYRNRSLDKDWVWMVGEEDPE